MPHSSWAASGTSGPSLYEVLTHNMRMPSVRRQVAPNLHVCGSHIDLAAAEVELLGSSAAR